MDFIGVGVDRPAQFRWRMQRDLKGFGHPVGRSIVYGYVRRAEGVAEDWMAAGRYELEVATARVPATLHTTALWDPENKRIRA